MRAPISVIIPTLNAEPELPGCLAALMEGVEAGVIRELIVTDGGSTDATQNIAEAVGAEWIVGPASRGGQLQRGCDAASGDWLLIVHADTQLAPGWTDAMDAALASRAAYYGRLRFNAPGMAARLVAGWANLRSRVFGLPYGDQALLIHRRIYDAADGYPDIPLMEDVALARALNGKLRPMAVTAITSAEKYQKQGWLRRGARNLWALLRYFVGTRPEALAKRY